ncbi:GlcG/HbpS family heme-binding protein [Oceaniglobus trochenteri]|uniref:GlcG/HbpS family heme-binding protein n=1 Tax=Oceaniglobus trochenteri TaxID=2763260 RepID=UPI001CFFE5CC|nr:heme-binding protein [Oceaniglobus trochenteri]
MDFTEKTMRLTHAGVMKMLEAAIARATEAGQPQCIVIVDASGETLGELRMTGAKFLSLKSARAKARTAASIRAPSANIPEAVRAGIPAATEGNMTALPGGLPIRIDGHCLGGIGVGSGTGDQDVDVANAALAAIGADLC